MLGVAGRAAALLLGGSAIGLAVNAARPGGVELAGFAPATTCAAGPRDTVAVAVVPPAEATRFCGDPRVLVADVRAADRFARGHIADAIHLPCGSSGDAASRALVLMADKHTVVVYGDSTEEARPVAETIRQRLAASRSNTAARIVVLDGGFSAWDRAGLACSSGPCPACGEGKAHAHAK